MQMGYLYPHLTPHLPPCGVDTTHNTVLQQISTKGSAEIVPSHVKQCTQDFTVSVVGLIQ